MASFIHKKLTYISFLSGLVLGVCVIAITNYLRPLDNPGMVVLTQLVMIIALGLITGRIVKDQLRRSYLVSTTALLYAYAISITATVVTNTIHYGLSVLVTGLVAIGFFYLGDKFFNRIKLHMAIKLLIAVVGFIGLFVVCSSLGLYILRTVVTPPY